MAEASCSGGTPFKRLIDHQARDVSHHQDRLTDRSALSNSSFRSSPAPQQSQDGFGAFMNGGPAMPGFHHDPASRLAAHAASLQPMHHPMAQSQPQFSQTPASASTSNWAADFTRFSSQQRPVQNNLSHVTANRQMNQSPATQLNFQSAFAPPSMAFAQAFPMNSFANPSTLHQTPVQQNDFNQEMSNWMTQHGGGNMEQVDAAMEQMARELEESEAATATAVAADAAIREMETLKTESPSLTDLETPEIGNLSLESRVEPEPIIEQEQVNADNQGKSAVAEAAEKLLECVQHEGGEKWQNSVFLSLMRDFRDGKKDIVGDEIRTTGDEPETATVQPQT